LLPLFPSRILDKNGQMLPGKVIWQGHRTNTELLLAL
jgi:hypothetical protein